MRAELLSSKHKLKSYIHKLDPLTYNDTSITQLHKMRGLLPAPEGEDYGQEETGIWENVTEHSAISMLVADVLGEKLGLSDPERGEVNLAVWLQDSSKKTERKWQTAIKAVKENPTVIFSEDELEPDTPGNLLQGEAVPEDDFALRQQIMLENLGQMEAWENAEIGLFSPRINELMKANVPKTAEGHDKDDLAAKISWFADAVSDGSKIVSVRKRMHQAEYGKHGKLNRDYSESFRNKEGYEGKSQYEVQREIGKEYEAEFIKKLEIRGLFKKARFYRRLKKEVKKRINSEQMPVMPPEPIAA